MKTRSRELFFLCEVGVWYEEIGQQLEGAITSEN